MAERFQLPEPRPRPSADDCPELDLSKVLREENGGVWHEPAEDPRLVENAYQKANDDKAARIKAKQKEIALDRKEMEADAERKMQRHREKSAASSGQAAVANSARLRAV